MKKHDVVFVPCEETSQNLSGGYTSLDGRSLCYVEEQQNKIILTYDELKNLIQQYENYEYLYSENIDEFLNSRNINA